MWFLLQSIRKELIKKYGDINSDKVFSLDDYKMYLLNNFLDEKYNNQKEIDGLLKKLMKE